MFAITISNSVEAYLTQIRSLYELFKFLIKVEETEIILIKEWTNWRGEKYILEVQYIEFKVLVKVILNLTVVTQNQTEKKRW